MSILIIRLTMSRPTRMRNTYMMPGEASTEDVIKDVKKGVYVNDVGNGEVYIGQGDFSLRNYSSHATIISSYPELL